MSQQGSNQNAQGSSVSAMVATLVPVLAVAIVLFGVFIFMERKFARVYAPRTYLETLDKGQRSPKHDSGFFGWIKTLFSFSDDYIVGHSSLDNYLWLRFFKMLTVISFVGCILTWPVLFPISATGGAGKEGLNILSFSNVEGVYRYFAYAIMSCIFLGFVIYLISRETMFFINLRQAYFLSPWNTSRISSKTVLFVDVPEYYRNEEHVRHILPNVRNVWLTYDPQDLQDMVDDRTDAAMKLENAEIKMISNYIKKQNKAGNNGEDAVEGRSGSFQVDPKNRPMHKLKPLIGKKVDTIEWSRGQLHELSPEIARKQIEQRSRKENPIGAVFVEFNTLRAAQAAYQQVQHQQVFHMTPNDIGMTPDSIIWKNLGMSWWQRKLRNAFGVAFMSFLCLFWTIPVAFVGVLSNVDKLTNKLPFLSFILDVPAKIRGVITGLLPVVLLAIIMALVPIFAMMIARSFEPTERGAQLKVQKWYFPFQVIQVFLITTFSSAAASTATQIIQDPTMAPNLLATNLPTASNFYIAYFILQGLMVSALQLLNIVPLLFVMVLGGILDGTPRKKYNRYLTLGGINWGSFYPKFANMGVIALSYSCIAPLVLGFAFVGFGLMYIGFRYNVFFTLGTSVDMKGSSYAMALQHLMVGVYLSEVCLVGLFAIGASKGPASAGPLIIEIIMLVCTILYHRSFSKAVAKHTSTLPNDLLAEEYHDSNELDSFEKGRHIDVSHGATAINGATNGNAYRTESSSLGSSTAATAYQVPESGNPPPVEPGLKGKIKKFLFPSTYASAAALSKRVLSPHLAEPVRPYTQMERDEAYMHPALIDPRPTVWLARDRYGFSQREVKDSQRQIGEGADITDQGAWFNEKGKVEWDENTAVNVPIFKDDRWTGGRDVY